jgi:zinc protease
LYLAWHSPALFAADDAELDLVADLLSSGKMSRLYRSLVYEQRMATEIAASQNSREAGGFFQIAATAAPGRTLTELDRAISTEIEAIAAGGPTAAEMERALAQAEAHFIFRLQTVGGFGGKSDQLNAYNVFLGDAGFFDLDLARYRQATADSLKRVAGTWLRRDSRVALSVVPHGRVALALPDSSTVAVG